MKITNKDKVKAATEAAKLYGPDENTHRHAFQAGAEWALSQMQNEWISVKDKLPETDNQYYTPFLVYLSGGHGRTIATFVSETKSFMGYDSPETVTHWMPMPEPPSQ